MSKKIEVELRILLKNRKAIEKTAKQKGAIFIKHLKVKDFWYCSKNVHDYKKASIDRSGFALRLRIEKDISLRKTKSSIECKTLHSGKNHAECNEYELPVEDLFQARKLLESINFKEFLIINKERKVYKYQKFSLFFDKIEGVGHGLEIEIMRSKGTKKVKYKQLLNLAVELGISQSEILKKSLTFIAMQKLASF